MSRVYPWPSPGHIRDWRDAFVGGYALLPKASDPYALSVCLAVVRHTRGQPPDGTDRLGEDAMYVVKRALDDGICAPPEDLMPQSGLTPCSDEWKVAGNKHSIPCSGSCVCTCGTDFPFPCECHTMRPQSAAERRIIDMSEKEFADLNDRADAVVASAIADD